MIIFQQCTPDSTGFIQRKIRDMVVFLYLNKGIRNTRNSKGQVVSLAATERKVLDVMHVMCLLELFLKQRKHQLWCDTAVGEGLKNVG